MHRKVLSLSYHVIVIFEQFIFSSNAHFPANVFHEIMWIIDALKKKAHNQNEQTIPKVVQLKFFFRPTPMHMSLFSEKTNYFPGYQFKEKRHFETTEQ